MQNYKDLNNKLHVIEPEFAHMLPDGCVPINDQEADAIRSAQVVLPTYRQLRAEAYPPLTDMADAVVKGGEALETYRAACLAVKAKYPKP